MKKRILAALLCAAVGVGAVSALAGCGSTSSTSSTTGTASTEAVSSEASSSEAVSSAAASSETASSEDTSDTSSTQADELAGTVWTVDIGEEYGAATQGDDSTAPTTLTLMFSDEGTASNVVGDFSFDYKINDDGTLEVSNLQNETSINNPELSLVDGKLTMNARINGGNATLTFEKEGTVDNTEATAPLGGTVWTADLGEEYGAATQGDDDTPLTTLTLIFNEDGTASNIVGDISFDYIVNSDDTVQITNLETGSAAINNLELSIVDGKLTMHARINGGNATVTFEQQDTSSEESDS